MTERRNGLAGGRILPWVLLTLSLVLNAFFVGGHYYTGIQLEEARASEGARTNLLAGRLGLNEGQNAAFHEMRTRINLARQRYDTRNARHADVIWSELARPEPDMARIDGNLDRFWDNRKALLKANVAAARDFLDKLDDDQRQAFINLARENPEDGDSLIQTDR